MKIARGFLFLCITIATLVLGTVAYQTGEFLWSAGIGLVGVIWIWAAWRGWSWLASLFFTLYAVSAGVGILRQMDPRLALFGVVFALGAWDLHHFYWRWQPYLSRGGSDEVAHPHLFRLGLIGLVSLLVSELALFTRPRLGFGLVVVVALLAIVMVGWVVSMVRRQE